MKHVVVTGGSGKLGYWVIKDLLEHGYRVTSVDRTAPKHSLCPSSIVNLQKMDEVLECLSEADALVHLAAYPAPNIVENDITFSNNSDTTYNVLEAADRLGLRKVVIGSSESIYGFVYAREAFSPSYFPIDEQHPLLPQECYGLSKIVNEETAAMFHRRSGMQITLLRFACVITPSEFDKFLSSSDLTLQMKRNMWSYIDVRDAASACRLGLEASEFGAEAFNITSDDTLVDADSLELIQSYYPEVTDIREALLGQTALYSNRKAKQLLNWNPQFSWRNHVVQSK